MKQVKFTTGQFSQEKKLYYIKRKLNNNKTICFALSAYLYTKTQR